MSVHSLFSHDPTVCMLFCRRCCPSPPSLLHWGRKCVAWSFLTCQWEQLPMEVSSTTAKSTLVRTTVMETLSLYTLFLSTPLMSTSGAHCLSDRVLRGVSLQKSITTSPWLEVSMFQQERSPTLFPLGMKKKVDGNQCSLPCLQYGFLQLLSVTTTSSWWQVEWLKMTPLSSTPLMYWTSPLWSGPLLKNSTSPYHCGYITWPFVEITSTWLEGWQHILCNH